MGGSTVAEQGDIRQSHQEVTVSKRHRRNDPNLLTRAELQAHAHAERHRIKSELHVLASSAGRTRDIDECDEPGVEWKPLHHLDHHRARERASHGRGLRHWKTKEWKRRTNQRRARARLEARRAKSV